MRMMLLLSGTTFGRCGMIEGTERRAQHQTTNLGVRSSNLFGRATSYLVSGSPESTVGVTSWVTDDSIPYAVSSVFWSSNYGAIMRTSFGTRGSQVQILPLRPKKPRKHRLIVKLSEPASL